MRQLLVVANWKMNGSRSSVEALLGTVVRQSGSPGPEVAVCPAYVHLAQALELCADSPITVGAQDCSRLQSGAFTGDVAPKMLADLGCRWVILGHSERRHYHRESDALVADKVAAAVEAGLSPIVCVGETLQQRDAGDAEAVVAAQLQGALGEQTRIAGLVIAYEPVWAIGTGLTATPEQAQGMHAYIRGYLGNLAGIDAETTRVLYGGSVRADNAAELFAQRDIDGALVGGASLLATEFLAIVKAAAV
jgi:triosephosphate isomerase